MFQTITVADHAYVHADAALEAVAERLYPAGVQDEAQYAHVMTELQQALVNNHFSTQFVELTPPTVAFNQRGRYYPQMQALAEADLAAMVEASRYDSPTVPEHILYVISCQNNLANAHYDTHFDALETSEQAAITQQLAVYLSKQGWQLSADERQYTKAMPFDEAGARTALIELLTTHKQDVKSVLVSRSQIVNAISQGAYGRYIRAYARTPPPHYESIITEVMAEQGYESCAEEAMYRPTYLTMPETVWPQVMAQLNELSPIHVGQSIRGVLTADVRRLVEAAVGLSLTRAELTYLVEHERGFQRILRMAGYATDVSECTWRAVTPKEAEERQGSRVCHYIRKEHAILRNKLVTIQLVKGMFAYTPTVAIDREGRAIVAMQMVGEVQALNANWATLVNGKSRQWIQGCRVEMGGMKQYVRLKTALKCGWHEQWLFHKQASYQEMSPTDPFYLLNFDEAQVVPSSFYMMLDKCLSVPLLPAWTDYLWQSGRDMGAIEMLSGKQVNGVLAYRVTNEEAMWREIVSQGFAAGVLRLEQINSWGEQGEQS